MPAYALHLWHELSRRAGFDKSIQPSRGSFLGQLIEKHGTSKYFPSSSGDSEDRAPSRFGESDSKGIALAVEDFLRPLDAKLQQIIETQARLSHETAQRDQALETSIGAIESTLRTALGQMEMSFQNFKYDLAREVWFEKQRWGLPYKLSSAWRKKFFRT